LIEITSWRTRSQTIRVHNSGGTADIISSCGDQIRSQRQAQNRGIYGNMNDGIALARGKYIAIYHSDDVYDPRIVEREVEFLELHPEAAAVFCKEVFIDPEGQEFGRVELPVEVRGGGPFDYRLIFNTLLTYKNHIFCCPTCMVRASVYRTLGTYREKEFRNTSDLEMYLRISRHYKVAFLDEYLICYRWGQGNSAQRYRYLRTDPSRFFTIMDLYLADGGLALSMPKALRAYEAHRAEDNLMRTVNHYILDQCIEARAVLKQISIRKLLASRRIMRWRLMVLFLLLYVVARLPVSLLWRIYFIGAGIQGCGSKGPSAGVS